MKKLLIDYYLKLKMRFQWSPKVHKISNLISLGSKYGSWVIPNNFLNENSVVYLAGAGEDISFDTEIVNKYNCKVNIFDPTPRAKKHYNELIDNIKHNKDYSPIGNDNYFYKLNNDSLEKLKFYEIGIWDKQEELKFFAPKKSEHVSHSVVNLQKTEDYFTAKVDSLASIMKSLQHSHIDLLKLDIEGAEYKVIESIIENKIKVKILCVEYDEAYNPLDSNYVDRIKKSLAKLMKYGYVVVDITYKHNYTLVLKEEFI